MNRIGIIIIVVQVFFNVVLIGKNIELNSSNRSNELKLQEQQSLFHDLVLFQTRYLPESFVNDSVVLIGEQGDRVHLNDLVRNEQMTILKVSQNNCLSCIESEFVVLSGLKEVEDSFIIIAQYDSYNEINLIKEKYNLNFSILRQINQDVLTSLDNLNLPYYFSIDSSMLLTSYFIADRNNSDVSSGYLVSRGFR